MNNNSAFNLISIYENMQYKNIKNTRSIESKKKTRIRYDHDGLELDIEPLILYSSLELLSCDPF